MNLSNDISRHGYSNDFGQVGQAVRNPELAVKLSTEPEPVQYRTLSPRFLALMEEIGLYGLEKYKERSVTTRFAKGDFSRDERTKSREIAKHAANHFDEYLDGVKHDKFNTREHQLAASAFNAMLEYQFFIEGR